MTHPTAAYVALGAALALAVVDWVAVLCKRKRLEYIAKPTTMVAVIVSAVLLMRGPHDVWQAPFFLAGFAFSLAGDVLLMLPYKSTFVYGLAAFLVAQICYIVGLTPSLPPLPARIVVAAAIAVGAILYQQIARGLHRSGTPSLLGPVVAYSLVLSLMLSAAWATLFRPEWTALRRALVTSGASLFFASDTMLAWDRFVRPSRALRIAVIVTYHVAQMCLAASIATPGA